jgi:hypothetical protein
LAEVQSNLGRLFADGKGEKEDTDGARPCIKEAVTEGRCPQLVRYKKEQKINARAERDEDDARRELTRWRPTLTLTWADIASERELARFAGCPLARKPL